MLMPPVDRYMTRVPVTLEPGSSVATAREVMTLRMIHHLPIVEGGNLVGILAERDVQVLAAVPGVDLERVEVSRVMGKPHAVWTETGLDAVAELMREQHCDCVVIRDRGGLKGIFTVVDALGALDDVLHRATC
jgi:acetoin utilization protein AcuB